MAAAGEAAEAQQALAAQAGAERAAWEEERSSLQVGAGQRSMGGHAQLYCRRGMSVPQMCRRAATGEAQLLLAVPACNPTLHTSHTLSQPAHPTPLALQAALAAAADERSVLVSDKALLEEALAAARRQAEPPAPLQMGVDVAVAPEEPAAVAAVAEAPAAPASGEAEERQQAEAAEEPTAVVAEAAAPAVPEAPVAAAPAPRRRRGKAAAK